MLEEVHEEEDAAGVIHSKSMKKQTKVVCKITKCERVGEGVNAYITYYITTKVDDGNTVQTIRRYSDFDWLWNQLRQEFKCTLIPPLPEKGLMNRFSSEFVEYRRKELQRFLKRVLNNPVLSKSAALAPFLSESEPEFQKVRSSGVTQNKTPSAEKEKKGISGFFSSLSKQFDQTITTVSSAMKNVELTEVDPWFSSSKSYVSHMAADLDKLQNDSSVFTQKNTEYAQALKELTVALYDLEKVEESDGGNKQLAANCQSVDSAFDQIAVIQAELAKQQEEQFTHSVKDYMRLFGAAEELLQNRDDVLLKLQREQANVDVVLAKKEKSKVSEKEITQAQEKEGAARDEFKEFSAKSKEEIDAFYELKSKELSKALRSMVQVNINNQLKILNLWKEVVNDLEEEDKRLHA
eukprot:TRINITY_DN5771_c0_g6_i1.p1 TRINITY_DN5771_c0_g6~~TRINITY_DN5771_c0_g6_i1.p1  ORF type:complete len:408 (+),score=110.34 TRINITY_DN5771_c0_g6_i1:1206-2429(+)